MLLSAIDAEHAPTYRQHPKNSCRPLVGQAEDGRLRAMGIRFELLPTGVHGQRSLPSQRGYLQVVVERADGVLADDIALLLLQSQCQRPVHILAHQPACSSVTVQAGQARSNNQCKQHNNGISLFHAAKLRKGSHIRERLSLFFIILTNNRP